MRFPIRTTQHLDFYRGDCRRQLEEFLTTYEPPPEGAPARVAAAVPHAGWRFSGGVAARTLKTLADSTPAIDATAIDATGADASPGTVVLLGAVHRSLLEKAAVYPSGQWQTPLGSLDVDAALAERIVAELGDLAELDRASHDGEHSIEVQMPMVHELFPGSRVVPILVPPRREAVAFGAGLAEVLQGTSARVVATTDLTHYGSVYGFAPAGAGREAHAWMIENDRRIIERALALKAEDVLVEAEEHGNACGPGALAAALAFARARGVREGHLVEHTDSYRVEPRGEPFRMAVGYAGMVF